MQLQKLAESVKTIEFFYDFKFEIFEADVGA
jgi:hypothetical protein